jgi:hypothetical protein
MYIYNYICSVESYVQLFHAAMDSIVQFELTSSA